jgi:sugar phosphate isomerase/epimerase
MDARCGICIDVGHAARAGADVVESIREAGARLFDMHIRTCAPSKRQRLRGR